jgi:hypothetical protein
VKDTHEGAMYFVYCDLIALMHKRGVLNIQDVANSLGDALDFRASIKGLAISDNANLKALYDHVRSLEAKLLQMDALKPKPQFPPE